MPGVATTRRGMTSGGRFAETRDDLGENTPRPVRRQTGREIFNLPHEGLGRETQDGFGFHVAARQRISHERKAFQFQAGAARERFDLLGVKEKNVPVGIGLELLCFVNSRIGTIRKFREMIPKISAVRRAHDEVAAWPDKRGNAREKLIRMRGVLDDLGDERGVEKVRNVEVESVARRIGNFSALVFEAHVIGQLVAPIVPGNFVTHFRERQGKISLRGGDIEDARAGWQNFGEQTERLAPPFFVGVGVAEMTIRPVNFFEIVKVG